MCSPTTPSLTSLPVELLEIVVKFVPRKANLARCSRLLYDIVQPQLYSQITIGGRRVERQTTWLLATALLKCPTLARHVRSLSLTCSCDRERPECLTSETVDEVFWPTFARLNHSAIRAWKWRYYLEGGVEITALYVFLPALVNLRRLELAYRQLGYNEDALLTDSLLLTVFHEDLAFNIKTSLPNCKEIIIEGEPFLFKTDLRLLLPYFSIPNLRGLYGGGLTASEPINFAFYKTFPSTSSVTHLELGGCNIFMSDMIKLLDACVALKTFILEWSIGDLLVFKFDSILLRNALDTHKETLENLWLQFSSDSNWNIALEVNDPDATDSEDLFDNFSPMESLEYFQALKHLRGELYLMFGDENTDLSLDKTNKLPPSLESLRYRRDVYSLSTMTDIVGRIQRVLEQKERYTPILKEIIFEIDWRVIGDFDFAGLEDLAIQKGVRILCKGRDTWRESPWSLVS